jgi:hypothetical protein
VRHNRATSPPLLLDVNFQELGDFRGHLHLLLLLDAKYLQTLNRWRQSRVSTIPVFWVKLVHLSLL